ncbi:beta-lactamase family protein [Streptomyces sp. BK208]|nr:beta-lactamase family protein [Streptomyces sp. BK208]
MRVEAGNRSLVYSGDTAPCPSLTELAEECDVLLCEAESTQVPPEGEQVHHTPEDAGDTARAARADRLIVTHVGRFLTPQQAVARASARFDGPVDYAAPGATFSIGETAAPRAFDDAAVFEAEAGAQERDEVRAATTAGKPGRTGRS